MSQSTLKSAQSALAEYFYDNYISDMPHGHKLLITQMEVEFAQNLARICDERWQKENSHVRNNIGVLSEENNLRNFEFAPQKAVEFRNNNDSLVLFMPTSKSDLVGSLIGFTTISFMKVQESLIDVYVGKLESNEIPKLRKEHLNGIRELVGNESIIEFLVQVHSSEDKGRTFAVNLHKIGLIPDKTLEIVDQEMFERNLRVSKQLDRRFNLFVSVAERFDSCGVSKSVIRNKLEKLLSSCEKANVSWLNELSLNDDPLLSFSNWPFNKSSDLKLESLIVKSFLNDDGSVNKKSKIKLDSNSGEFVSIGEVVIDWETTPKKVVADLKWRIEVLDSTDLEIADSIQILESGNNSRTKKIDLKNEVDYDNTRMIVRVSAQDSTGAILKLNDGRDAIAYSKDFILRINEENIGDTGESKVYADKNLMLAMLKTLCSDKYVTDLDFVEQSRFDTKGQYFETYLGHRSLRMRMSSFIATLQSRILLNCEEAFKYDCFIKLGNVQLTSESVTFTNLKIPDSLLAARKAFMEALVEDKYFSFPEVSRWNSDISEKLDIYLEEYKSALEKSDKETLQAILELDTLQLTVASAIGQIEGLIILPCHPLRLAWLRDYYFFVSDILTGLLTVDHRKRSNSIDLKLMSEISPANYPFVLSANGRRWLYSNELSFGTGIYLPVEVADVALTLNLIQNSIGITRDLRYTEAVSSKTAEHLDSYTKDIDFGPGIKLSTFNGGDGKSLADALEIYRKKQSNENRTEKNYEVVCFSETYSSFEPVGALSDLQKRLSSTLKGRRQGLFNSAMALRVHDYADFENKPETFNISLVQSATQTMIEAKPDQFDNKSRKALLNGLVTYLHSEVITSGEDILHITAPTISGSSNLSNLHSKFSDILGLDGKEPVLRLAITNENMQRLTEIHRRSDWVITADRFIQLSLYENLLARQNSNIVILDYSPDFVDGFGDRITLTTTKFSEITRVIGKAMNDLGLDNKGISAVDVIRDLSKISGRLAMRMLNDNSLATEALGLCAAMRYLQRKEWLENTIIIPVDAHQDLFGLNRFDPNGTKERCDLLLVKILEDGSYKLDLVEVKARKGRYVADLPIWMKNQLDNTESLLNKLLFSEDANRVDRDVQWSRWISLLHFYLDRSHIHGTILTENVDKLHNLIEIIGENQQPPVFNKLGFIVSLEAEAREDQQIDHDYKVIILSEERLSQDGWTTLSESALKSSEVLLIEDDRLINSETENGANHIVHLNTEKESPNFDEPVIDSIVEEKLIKPFIEESIELSALEQMENSIEISKSSSKINVILGHTSNDSNTGLASEREVEWNVELQGSPHAVVVGIPGQGKSVTTINIINQFHQAGLPSLVFDFHGEMKNKVNFQANIIDVPNDKLPFSPFDFYKDAGMPIRSAAQEIAESLASIGDLGDIQTANVVLAIRKIYEDLGWTDDGQIGQRLPNIEDFRIALALIEAQNKGKNASTRLMSFTDYSLFDPDNQSAIDFREKGYVFDVSAYRIDEVKITIGAFILRKLYNDMFTWGNADKPRVAVVLDEAHRLSKDPTIPKLMKEGRKYGVVVILVSQSLDDFAPQVVENVGLKVVFRTNFPASKKVAQLVRGRSTQDIPKIIETLTTARALVSLPGQNKPLLTQMQK